MIWSHIPGYEGRYEVSCDGAVRNSRRNKPVKHSAHPGGYRQVTLYRDGSEKKHYVHRLVAQLFVTGYLEGAEVNHKNGNKADNRAKNLEWVSRAENVRHSYAQLKRKQHAKTTPVKVGETVFPSMLAAARAHGVRAGAVWSALSRGRNFQGKEIRRV